MQIGSATSGGEPENYWKHGAWLRNRNGGDRDMVLTFNADGADENRS